MKKENSKKQLCIALVFNLQRAHASHGLNYLETEYDSEDVILGIKDALELSGHKVILIEANRNVIENIKTNSKGIDIVFNIAEGLRGEARESHVPCVLEMLGIPYTGSGPITMAITLDKARTKEILLQNGISTPEYQVFNSANDRIQQNLRYPLIVKPIAEGSSIGISGESVVQNENALRQQVDFVIKTYRQPALVERFLTGREFTVGILGNENPRVFPIIEICLEKYEHSKLAFTLENKFIVDNDENSCVPKNLSLKLRNRIREAALQTYRALNCRDFSRIDIRCDENNIPNVLEINPLPGLNPKVEYVSYFVKAARLAGLGYNEMVNEVLNAALKRYGIDAGMRAHEFAKEVQTK